MLKLDSILGPLVVGRSFLRVVSLSFDYSLLLLCLLVNWS